MKPNVEDLKKVKLVDQVWTTRGRTFHVACGEARLTIVFESRKEVNTEQWHAELRARIGSSEDFFSTKKDGPNQREALRACTRAWQEEAASRDLFGFDWEAIEGLLTAVRAL